MSFDITRTELVWPGKYDEDGMRREAERASLPFQVIERVNESRATREAEKTRNPSLFDTWQGDSGETFEDGWRNKLIWGDNQLVMSSLLDQFAGKIDLIYIDPPFATGADFSMSVPVGDEDAELFKEASIVEEKAYRDTWGRGMASYVDMIAQRLQMMRDLLSDRGSIYVHCDHRVVGPVRVLCDEVFGADRFENMVTWRRQIPRGMKVHARFMPFSADFLLLYTKTESAIWNAAKKETLISIAEADKKYMKDSGGYFRTSDPGTYSDASLIRLHEQGRIYVTKGGEFVVRDGRVSTTHGSIGVKYYREQRGNKVVEEAVIDNIWDDVPGMGVVSAEYVGYPTQKPEGLLRRIIQASTADDSLVADFFCGSGTTQVVAERLGRRWIGVDLGRFAVHTTRKRLLGIEGCRPFEVLNLGKYERQYWAAATFGEDLDGDGVVSIYEYIVFVLKLYEAQAVTGLQHLHGRKGNAFVHVGAVDSPVTIDEIVACVDEGVALKSKEVHVLGWEWEMGLHDPITDAAKERGVNLVLRQIPREVMEAQAVDKGDVEFFELAYLDVEIVPTKKKREVVAELKSFVIPNPELVPDDVRSKIKKWSDYVDYWAVDWKFSDDTFMQSWVTYRTRKNRTLELASDPHAYDSPGSYNVMVKVIDIFGNDTSKIIPVRVD
jgi:adenine-specific DNA-methyltransferase